MSTSTITTSSISSASPSPARTTPAVSTTALAAFGSASTTPSSNPSPLVRLRKTRRVTEQDAFGYGDDEIAVSGLTWPYNMVHKRVKKISPPPPRQPTCFRILKPTQPSVPKMPILSKTKIRKVKPDFVPNLNPQVPKKQAPSIEEDGAAWESTLSVIGEVDETSVIAQMDETSGSEDIQMVNHDDSEGVIIDESPDKEDTQILPQADARSDITMFNSWDAPHIEPQPSSFKYLRFPRCDIPRPSIELGEIPETPVKPITNVDTSPDLGEPFRHEAASLDQGVWESVSTMSPSSTRATASPTQVVMSRRGRYQITLNRYLAETQ